MTTEKKVIPRNKNGKTNDGIKYRYGKAKKSSTLRSDKVDLSVLTKKELELIALLKGTMTVNGKKVAKQVSIAEIQEEIFSAASYANYGTSDTRNILRRMKSSGLVQRCGRGLYRLNADKVTKAKERAKKAAKPAKAPAKKAAKKAAPKKKAAKKAPAKKKAAKKPAKKKAAAKKAA